MTPQPGDESGVHTLSGLWQRSGSHIDRLQLGAEINYN